MDRIFLSLGAIAIVVVVVVVGVVQPELEETREQRAEHETAMLAIEQHEAEHWQENHMPVVQSAQRGASVVVLWGSGTALVLLLFGGAAAVVARGWLWALSAHQLEHARIQASVDIARANNTHPLPPSQYAPNIGYAPRIDNATPAHTLPTTENFALPGEDWIEARAKVNDHPLKWVACGKPYADVDQFARKGSR